MEEMRNACKILVRKSEGRDNLEDLYLKEVGWEGMDLIHMAQLRTTGRLL
jgi:hypothetical protein